MQSNKKPKYTWPPERDESYVPRQRNTIHSVLTALPVIMLVVGLYVYYRAESKQTEGAPIREYSTEVDGIFTGLSVVNAGNQGRHYLWFEDNGASRGARLQAEHASKLDLLIRGQLVKIRIAPTVPNSSTVWVWYVEQDGTVYLNEEASLQ
ncbi:MAG: hypothetical protein KTR32_13200 [Granulosicoccus sp.]|nr:hypothetical protein [Granulosicoccus sp.]